MVDTKDVIVSTLSVSESEIKMGLDEFLASRTELPQSKITLLKYLATHGSLTIIPLPRGRSKISVYFDDGAYKGGQVLSFIYQTLTPINVAQKLLSLTDGWHFNFDDADTAILNSMAKELK